MQIKWRTGKTTSQHAYERAILDEILLVLDFVAGCPEKKLLDINVVDPDRPGSFIPAPDVLARLAAIDNALSPQETRPLAAGDRSFLILVRDALNTLIRPASGLTVAYTAMVVGNRRGEAVKSRAVLAEQAYAGLRGGAWQHRWGQRFMLIVALLLTLGAAWDSAKVALGKSLLHNLLELRGQQAELSKEKLRIEEAFSAQNAPTANLVAMIGSGTDTPAGMRLTIRLCDRPPLLGATFADATPIAQSGAQGGVAVASHTPLYESAAQRDVCDRDKLLGLSFKLAHQAINAYMENWPAVAGTGFDTLARVERIVQSAAKAACDRAGLPCDSPPNPLIAMSKQPDAADSELLVAPGLIVLGNFVLPVIFALLGAAAFVILDFYNKLRDSRLAPRDHVLSWIRLVLGSVIGACIGLFFSSYGPPPQGGQADLIGALTLSASGVAFLAGFGVEGVFAMLGNMVTRVFPTGGQTGGTA